MTAAASRCSHSAPWLGDGVTEDRLRARLFPAPVGYLHVPMETNRACSCAGMPMASSDHCQRNYSSAAEHGSLTCRHEVTMKALHRNVMARECLTWDRRRRRDYQLPASDGHHHGLPPSEQGFHAWRHPCGTRTNTTLKRSRIRSRHGRSLVICHPDKSGIQCRLAACRTGRKETSA